jgi:hypothetical protein
LRTDLAGLAKSSSLASHHAKNAFATFQAVTPADGPRFMALSTTAITSFFEIDRSHRRARLAALADWRGQNFPAPGGKSLR